MTGYVAWKEQVRAIIPSIDQFRPAKLEQSRLLENGKGWSHAHIPQLGIDLFQSDQK